MQLSFWAKNKVFVFGLLSALSVVLTDILHQPTGQHSGKAYLFAALIAVLGYVARTWRGQGATLLGLIGTSAGVAVDQLQGGSFTWYKFAIAVVLAILATVAPPPKPLQIENGRTL